MALPSIQLGPYQLHERIGEGGNGQVYRATGPGGTVAVKLIGSPHDFDDATLARFRREIAALRELAHPSLIALVDHGVDPELGPYLVLPLLAGQTLRRLLEGRAVCPEAALLLILPIAEAVAALHARGFVHRDLKPENAIASPDGAITVIDLGLAWGEHMTRHTESGAAVGSIGYMSPEQLDGQQVGPAADVWAIGVMIYEAVAGKRPFARPRPTEEVAATLLGSHAKLSAADRRASEELAAIVGACLALDAAKRPSIDTLVAQLRAQVDWTDDIAGERAAAIADPAGYQARIAAFRVRRLERQARDAIAAGKPFVALAVCDRGLAYAPEHATLLALIGEAEAATASGATAPPEPAPAAGSGSASAASGFAPAAAGSAAAAVSGLASGAAAPGAGAASGLAPGAAGPGTAPAPRTNTAWIVGATIVGVAGIFAFAWYQNQREDPWKVRRGDATVTSTSTASDSDKALVRDFVGLFSKAIDASSKAPSGARRVAGTTPTTATGWLELARTQEGAEAVASIRQALALSPDWPVAQDALCLALAAVDDPGAIEVCTRSLARSPRDLGLHAARASVLMKTDRHAEALADLDAVIALDPAPKWRRVRAAARLKAGDAAAAKQDLEHACQLGDAVACQELR